MTKKPKPPREERYSQIYWPVSIQKLKSTVYDLLLDIDCNYSRIMQSILPNLKEICNLIASEGKNFRHFEWHLLIIDKKTGEGYSSLCSGEYTLTNLTEKANANDGIEEKEDDNDR
ncbi:hypothetical protein LCGC14_1388750 [marine sediment metagenome]|uniref:Uncharacterized protein n=1 Tax=marine sediment metagenome TaxID=412755 RepID=A0A0F9KLD6_9ZZZZ